MNLIATTPQAGPDTLRLIDRALLTAHLLTGNLHQAEEVTLNAIESWRPGEEPEESLFEDVLDAAARARFEPDPNYPDPSGWYLPNELQAVLRLAPQLRRCYVLRILAGVPAKACARMLSLPSDMVEEYTGDAIRRLARGYGHQKCSTSCAA